MTDETFAAWVRRAHEGALLVALEMVTTHAGALRILRAEASGRRRGLVLLTAHRRLAQLEGHERPGQRVSVIAEAVAEETARLDHERRREGVS